eukprot:3880851-Pyramimonas_sp.AAC.1
MSYSPHGLACGDLHTTRQIECTLEAFVDSEDAWNILSRGCVHEVRSLITQPMRLLGTWGRPGS